MRTAFVAATLLASTFVINNAAQAVEPTSLPPVAPPPVAAKTTGGFKTNTNFIVSKNRIAKNGRGGLKVGPSKSKKAAAKARVAKLPREAQ